MEIDEKQNEKEIELNKIEEELGKCVKADKNNWTEIYKLMLKVQDTELFAAKYKSFSQWVNYVADINKVHISVMWARFKAGKVYADYEERAAKQGKSVVSIDKITIPADSLIYIEKIASSDNKLKDDLIEKVEAGELRRSDLKNAWKTVKSKKDFTKIPRNGYELERLKKEEEKLASENEDRVKETTAEDVVIALSTNRNWYGKYVEEPSYLVKKAKSFTEFPVQTGTSRHSRRMDFLLIENQTTTDRRLCIHGVEIKVSIYDLESDEKMQEYTDFCDKFYIAVPDKEELIAAAKNYALEEWGILAIAEDKTVRVEQPAKLKTGILRADVIETALLKTI